MYSSWQLILTTLLLTMPTLGFAQEADTADRTNTGTSETETASSSTDARIKECALIKDGVKRLLCYDNRNDPEKARKASTSETIEQVEQETVDLSTGAARKGDGQAPDGESSDDSGVMNALVDRYVATEKALFSFSGSFVPHRPTYLMPFSWAAKPNQRPFSPTQPAAAYDDMLDNKEAKYQISFKVPLLTGVLDGPTTFWFGYTQLSFWQVYNSKHSAPFRETDYEPELFLRYQTDFNIGPGTLNAVSVGLNHQSNGRSDPQSRSWNRITVNATYTYNRWLFMIAPWYRLPEDRKDDDNPDIQKYLGYADYWAVYKWSEDKTLALKVRNNLRSDSNKTSIELGYSFPMGGKLKGYIQYYNGYGESLIDYNVRIHRLGIGVMLNDWL